MNSRDDFQTAQGKLDPLAERGENSFICEFLPTEPRGQSCPRSVQRFMGNILFGCLRLWFGLGIFLLVGGNPFCAQANPAGGSVVGGDANATISGEGTPQVTINQSAQRTFINWSSFNIGVGETVNFNQPTSTSVTWNQINDSNPSQILGTLNANGYVILQNPNGFYVGGQAAINAHGLVMTTASTPTLNLSSGGPWSFNTPPPTAKIINYGQINIAGGGSAFLIADDIENNGSISAPNGKIGLYAGQKVLVSMSPDGRGLSAQATVTQGLVDKVDNNGNLAADAGNITLQAQTVNQNGVMQANSVQDVNGTIELVASDSISLGASSSISANGDSTASTPSSGGSVTIQSGNSFSDQAGSAISVAGATQGGNGGQVAISAPQMSALNSIIEGQAIVGYADPSLSINTVNIALNTDGNLVPGALALDVNSLSGLSQINLQAAGNITLAPNSAQTNPLWVLTPNGNLGSAVSLAAGNSITVDAGAGIEADAGKITLSAPTVNQNGTLQANSVGTANGVVEIDASDSLNLGAASQINANGDPAATSPNSSPGGFVVLNAGNNTFTDTKGSAISVSGTAGGQNGIIEIFGNGVTASTIQSTIGSYLAYLINPGNLYLSSSSTSQNTQPANTDPNTSNPQLWANLNVGDLSAYSQIDLQALNNINLNSTWSLGNPTVPSTPTPLSTLSLSAGNNVTLNSSLNAGYNWNVSLTAGTSFVPTSSQPKPQSGNDGIYVYSSLQTGNGNITLDAANEVMVGSGVRTVGGGNIDVTTQYGDVNTGTSPRGFQYLTTAPYDEPLSSLGGISTAAGGNVTINAGGNVISFPTTISTALWTSLRSAASPVGSYSDPGTGAFGPEPGNVTINAVGSVYGCYVVMNGTGIINAGQDVGTSVNNQNVALSLANGSWTLNAQGDIYLQEVRNPNGAFNNSLTYYHGKSSPSAVNHLFDYAPNASVTLTAGNAVFLTGLNLPRPDGVAGAVPLLLPPIVIINAGAGGVTLQTPSEVDNSGLPVYLLNPAITLFPSADGNLEITTTDGGGLIGAGSKVVLLMSDSGLTQWFNTAATGYQGPQPFGQNDHASVPAELNNPDPVVLNIAGDMQNLTLQVCKLAQINVGGDMIGCTFYGENLQPDQTTSLYVGGQIYNAVSFSSVTLDSAFPTLSSALLPPSDANNLFQILVLAVNPDVIKTLPGTTSTSDIYKLAGMFPGLNTSGVSYNPNTQTLTVLGPMSGSILAALEQPSLTFVVYQNGVPEVKNGQFVTETIPWTPANTVNYTDLQNLFAESQGTPGLGDGGYVVAGTGTFDVTANSIALGNSYGILSVGSMGSGYIAQFNYSFLAPYITSGATINVTVLGQEQTVKGLTEPSLYMPASTIAALAGGDVNVTCLEEMPNPNGTGGISMDLGSQNLADVYGQIMDNNKIAMGIYTTGGGDVNVTALGDINVDTSRIASFNGGNVFVESYTGNVNAGSGGSTFLVPILVSPPDAPGYGEQVYANGIVAQTFLAHSGVPGAATAPGNITVWTPEGDIIANVGGIKQEARNGTVPTGPTITLTAGTPAPGEGFNSPVPPLYVGNIDLGTVGAIGETIIAQATGKISGLAFSQHNATITSQTVGNLTVLAGGVANVSAQSSGNGSGITIIGGQGVNTTGIGAGATLLGQNVSVNGGAATSTLGTTAASTAASQSAAGQSSSEAQQQVASNSGEKKKKKKKKSELVRSVGRVTIILPKAS